MAQINMKNKKKNDDSSSIGYNRTNVAVKILCDFRGVLPLDIRHDG